MRAIPSRRALVPGAFLLVVGAAGGWWLWSPAPGEWSIRLGSGHVEALAFSPDGTTIVSYGPAGYGAPKVLRVWDAGTGKHRRTVTIGGPQGVGLVHVAFAPGGRTVAIGVDYPDKAPISIWDTATGVRMRVLTSMGTPLAVSPDGRMLAAAPAGADPTNVDLWDLGTGGRARWLPTSIPRSTVFSRDGTLLAISSGGGTAVWDVTTDRFTARFSAIGPNRARGALALSPDGTLLALGDEENLAVWAVGTAPAKGRDLFAASPEWMHKEQGAHAAAFSPDGRLLAAGYAWPAPRGVIRLWDASTGKLVRTLEGHTGDAYALAFSPDGKWLVSGGSAASKRLQVGVSDGAPMVGRRTEHTAEIRMWRIR